MTEPSFPARPGCPGESCPPEPTEQSARLFRLRYDDVEFQLLEGGRRFPSRAGPIWEACLNRTVEQALPPAAAYS
jgi:hypothetical protein